jgi:hypothetical protein
VRFLHKPTASDWRFRAGAIGLATITFVVVASAASGHGRVAAAGSKSAAPPVGTLSNVGVPVGLTSADATTVSRLEAATGLKIEATSLLGTKASTQFYALRGSAGNNCYATGAAGATAVILGQVRCNAAFPSAAQPILDFTSFTQVVGDDPGSARVAKSAGLAADGVSDVALAGDNGQIMARTPVVNNVYAFVNPPTEHVAAILAEDAQGNVLASRPFGAVSLK